MDNASNFSSLYICAYVHLLTHTFLAEVYWWIPLRLRVGDEFEQEHDQLR